MAQRGNNSSSARIGRGREKVKGVSEGWHGRKSRDTKVIKSQYSYPSNLANLAWMIDIEIFDPDEGVEILEFPEDKFILACGSSRTQLYIVSANGKRFDLDVRKYEWITESEAKKPEIIIGEAGAISYFTDKHHLQGPAFQKDGAEYRHPFGLGDNDDEEAEKYTPLEERNMPFVVYDRMNGEIKLLGGSYEVTDLGIKG